jgi:hypothetical protein
MMNTSKESPYLQNSLHILKISKTSLLWSIKKTKHWTKTTEPYLRTDPQILREAATITITIHQMPIKTSHQMMPDDSINAPNAKQIRDKVYRDSKKDPT